MVHRAREAAERRGGRQHPLAHPGGSRGAPRARGEGCCPPPAELLLVCPEQEEVAAAFIA